jgi:DNA-directed RNA polymerase subunit N (RpoN/RPB10)
MIVCHTCQTNLEELRPTFKKILNERITKYLQEHNIQDTSLARNSVDVNMGDVLNKMMILKDRYCCRSTLMSYRTQLELLGFVEPFKRN